MITNGFGYIAFLIFFSAIIIFMEKRTSIKIFKYVPALVVIYFGGMLLSTFGLWQRNDEITATYKTLKYNLLPAMIFLMLLKCDLRKILKLGPKMILSFFVGTFSIFVGFIVAYLLFKGNFQPDTWKPLATLAGSWTGGSSNMVAVQGALNVSDSSMGYALLVDSVNSSLWIMLLLWAVSFAPKFNKWTKADTSALDEVSATLMEEENETRKNVEFVDLMVLIGVSLFVSAIAQYAAGFFPQSDFLSAKTWTVLIVTLLGVLGAMTPIAKLPGSAQLANVLVYTIVALIASRANFSQLTEAPMYVAFGFVILGIHLVTMLTLAKVLKLDLFTCGIASLANIGGLASTPVLAGAYDEILVPIGILMALMGTVVGTGAGLLIGKILSML